MTSSAFANRRSVSNDGFLEPASKWAIELAGIPVETVIPLATEAPARIANVADRKGRIERRYDADLVVLNDRFEVERVWARGHEVGNV